ncbi:cytochrome o ubiquinol oxidase subunit IV [Caulobacter sp. KR2-114]|uniref:cytochrome o ubiquinol oxidase subunit IV n=1 Tax=Caulobacter sp. KR2-114 TaxID=3400912 RepID=UPI003C0BC6FD
MTDAAAHGAHEEHGHGAPHATRRDYVVGFLLAAALTVIPFWLVMSHLLENAAVTGALVMGLAAVQVVAHMVFFLHMNRKAEGGWTLMALLFTLLLVGIVLSGSMWVMHHLDVNMMPMSAEAMRQAP